MPKVKLTILESRCRSGCVKEGDVFTQNEINEGAIKYYNTKKASVDSFKLKAADYTGATLSDPLIVNVNF